MAKSGSSWQPGQSGNPRGRRPDAAIAKARIKLARSLPAVLDMLISAALAGDIGAAKLIVERLIPVARPDYADLADRLTALEAHDEPRN